MGRFDSLRELGSAWVDKQKRRLQGKPQTLVDSGGSGIGNYSFNEQAHSRDALKEIKEMREDGGVIATLVHAKALMTFGGGFELESEVDGVEDWINTELPNLETKLLELGEDALWYPYAAGETVETRGNDFSHIAGIEPWTLQPQTDETGSIQYWEQQIGRMDTQRFETDEIGAIVLNKSCARDTTGISDVLRAREEIEHYVDIERMVQKSAEVAAVPHNHWQVGRENGAPLDDNDLRRVRTLVERLEGDTQIITGPDVNHERISADDYDFETLIAHKLRQVAIALGVPLEMVASGDHGLGAGSESEIRMRVFEKDARANQRSFANQFENEFLIPIVNEYSPYNVDNTELSLNFTDPIERDDRAEKIQQIGEDMTIDERREAYDLEPVGGDIGDSYDTARGETTEDEGGEGGGLFASEGDTDFRNLKDIEDIDTVPPESVQNDAQMALDWREETGNPNDCGTQVGWERANQIVNGESLSEDTINRMVSFFSRHEKGGDSQPKEDCSRMMWKAWGGDDGKEWAERKQEEFEQAREAAQAVFALQVPDEAVSISDRSEAPEDAKVITGDQGGLYYIPAGAEEGEGDETTDVTASPEEIEDFEQTAVEEGDEIIIEDTNGEKHQVDVKVVGSDDALVVEDSQGNREVIEPDGETRTGNFKATGMVDDGETSDGGDFNTPSQTPEPRETIDAPLSEGGLREFDSNSSPDELAESIPTIDERFDEELEGIPVSPDLDLSEEDVEFTRDTMSDMMGSFKNEELLSQYYSRLSHFHGESTGGSMSRGHATEGRALGNEGNMMTHFKVTNPSNSSTVVQHEMTHTIHQALGYQSGGEGSGANGGFQEYNSPTSEGGDDAKDIESALMSHENEDSAVLPEGESVDGLMESVEVADGKPEQASDQEILNIMEGDVDGSPEEQFRDLVAEVNKAFLKTQGVKDRAGERAAQNMVKRPYQMTNTNEFMAVASETLQTGDKMATRKLVKNHPNLVDKYANLFEIDEDAKDIIEFEKEKRQ